MNITVTLDTQIVWIVYLALGIFKESCFSEYVQLLITQNIYRGIIIILYMYILFCSLQSFYLLGNQLDLHKELSEVDRGQEYKRGQRY